MELGLGEFRGSRGPAWEKKKTNFTPVHICWIRIQRKLLLLLLPWMNVDQAIRPPKTLSILEGSTKAGQVCAF